MIDPGKDAKTIARNAIGAASNQLFGGIVGRVVGDHVLDLIGLGGSSGESDYLAKIDARIDAMQADIAALKESVTAVEANTDTILNDVTVLIGKLDEDTADIELQSALKSLQQAGNVIKQNYASYRNAVAAIAGSDQTRRAGAAHDLYGLFQITNMQTVAEAMSDVADSFAPQVDAGKGIPQMHLNRMYGAIEQVAANPPDYAYWLYDPPFGRFIIGAGLWGAITATADNELRLAAGTIKLGAALQVQALTLLSTAWLGTAQEPSVLTQTDVMTRMFSALQAFLGTAAGPCLGCKDLSEYGRAQILKQAVPLKVPPVKIWHYEADYDMDPGWSMDWRIDASFRPWDYAPMPQGFGMMGIRLAQLPGDASMPWGVLPVRMVTGMADSIEAFEYDSPNVPPIQPFAYVLPKELDFVKGLTGAPAS